MNVTQPIRPALNAQTVLNMREVAHLLGVSPATATAKVKAMADELKAFKTSGTRGQWRVRYAELRRVFGLPPLLPTFSPRHDDVAGNTGSAVKRDLTPKERRAGRIQH